MLSRSVEARLSRFARFSKRELKAQLDSTEKVSLCFRCRSTLGGMLVWTDGLFQPSKSTWVCWVSPSKTVNTKLSCAFGLLCFTLVASFRCCLAVSFSLLSGKAIGSRPSNDAGAACANHPKSLQSQYAGILLLKKLCFGLA